MKDGYALLCFVGWGGHALETGRGYVWLNLVTRKEAGSQQERLRQGPCRKPVQCDMMRASPGVVEVVVVTETCDSMTD